MTYRCRRWAALTLVTMAGCSFFTADGAPSLPIDRNQTIECRGQDAPIIDTVLAALLIAPLPVVAATTKTCTGGDCYGVPYQFILAGAAFWAGIGTGASAITGYVKVSNCNRARETQEACRAGDMAACARLVPPPRPPAGEW
jgi:hypothetical protein